MLHRKDNIPFFIVSVEQEKREEKREKREEKRKKERVK